ncbi:MAG: nicotinate phosphoribosyltransferase, partial [Nitrospirae bacterium]
LYSVKIFASGNLDEYILEDIIKAGAPIDGFGIGTRLDTSSDVPYLDCAYKLQEYAGKVRRKRSRGKATLPGRKQVYRYYDKDGKMSHDLLTTEDDKQDGRALIEPVMIGGKRLSPPRSLEDIRAYTSSELSLLPDRFKKLKDHPIYPVKISERIEELVKKVDREFR